MSTPPPQADDDLPHEAEKDDLPPGADDDDLPPGADDDELPPLADGDEFPPATDDAAQPPARPQPVAVGTDEDGLRLDRWFRRRFPHVGHAQLERWLRTGQIRVDGHRAKAADRLQPGQQVRVPPAARAPDAAAASRPAGRPPSPEEAAELLARVLYRDACVLVIDKPAGLAVQGGTRTARHLDGLLDALAFDGERPRLVHRLDKDTSGVLVLARTAAAATALTAAFASRAVHKLYWAVVAGVPPAAAGRISQPLGKRYGAAGERVGADDDGRPALTTYRVIERAGGSAAWLALVPRTGRTHQLRAHCVVLGTPILGDGKYGGAAAFLAEAGDATRLHLHARAIRFHSPAGGEITVEAPLPPHIRATFRFFGFDERVGRGPPPEWAAPRHATGQVTRKAAPPRDGRKAAPPRGAGKAAPPRGVGKAAPPRGAGKAAPPRRSGPPGPRRPRG